MSVVNLLNNIILINIKESIPKQIIIAVISIPGKHLSLINKEVYKIVFPSHKVV